MEAINNHGLEALVWIANHYQKNVTKEQLMHAIGMQTISPTDLELRECAQVIGYETQQVSLTYQQLAQIPLPALIFIDQQWHILTQNQPLTVMSAQGSEIVQWQDNNQLEYPVLLIKEQLEPEQKRAFGIGWFIPSIIRQRFKLKNIFILAAIVQLFALISPLLFQNLIDKV